MLTRKERDFLEQIEMADFKDENGMLLNNNKAYQNMVDHMKVGTFSKALELLKEGKKVARKGWNGKDMWVACEKVYTYTDLQVQDVNSTFSHPLLIIKNVNGKFATWVPSVTDLFANDWEIVE